MACCNADSAPARSFRPTTRPSVTSAWALTPGVACRDGLIQACAGGVIITGAPVQEYHVDEGFLAATVDGLLVGGLRALEVVLPVQQVPEVSQSMCIAGLALALVEGSQRLEHGLSHSLVIFDR